MLSVNQIAEFIEQQYLKNKSANQSDTDLVMLIGI